MHAPRAASPHQDDANRPHGGCGRRHCCSILPPTGRGRKRVDGVHLSTGTARATYRQGGWRRRFATVVVAALTAAAAGVLTAAPASAALTAGTDSPLNGG